MAGVAPGVELVNIRAGQDSGYFFLKPSVDALTYAADIGVDVVNMSYYIDPWLYNCADNPADSPAEQLEQRTIIEATERALAYARAARRDPGVRRGQRQHRPRQAGDRRDEPGLPAGERAGARDRQLVREHAARGAESARHHLVRAERPQGVLLGLRPGAGRPVGARRRQARFLRHAAVRHPGEHRAGALPEGAGHRQRGAEPGRHAEHARSCWPTARAARISAPTTSTCRARRWRRRTPSAWPRWWCPHAAATTGATAGSRCRRGRWSAS